MPREKVSSFLKNNSFQILLQVIGFLIVVLNLWLASKLAPMGKDIALIQEKVVAIENKQDEFIVRSEFNLICERLDRIQNTLNDLIKLHMK